MESPENLMNPSPLSVPPSRTALRQVWLFVAVFLLAVLVFLPSVEFRLVELDDSSYVANNPLVMEDSPLAALPACFTSFQQAMYAPFLWCSYALDAFIFRASPASPWGFHLANVLLHAANAALFALLLSRFCKNRFVVFFCAAFWAIHPLRVESVAWVTERKDVLSAFFALLSAIVWLQDNRSAPPLARMARFLLSLLFFATALLTKVSVAPLPAALFFLECWPLRRISLDSLSGFCRSAPRRLPILLPFFVLSAIAAFLASAAHGHLGAIRDIPLSARCLSVPVHAAFYLFKTILPIRLSPLYPDLVLSVPRVLLSILLLGTLGLLAFRLRHRTPALSVGLLVFAVFFFPSSGIVRFGIQSIADRFTYLPALGLSIALSSLPLAIPASIKSDRVARCLPFAVLALLAVATLRLLPSWRDPDSFRARILRFNPNQPHALAGEACRLLEANRLREALPFAAKACAQRDFTVQSPLALALVLQELGRPEEALRALETTPRAIVPPYQLFLLDWETARVFFSLGRFDDALAAADAALCHIPTEEAPQRPFLHLLAMAAAHRAGHPDKALAHARAFPAYASKTSVSDADLLPFFLYEWMTQHRVAAVPFFRPLIAPGADPDLANNLLWGFATSARSPFPPSEILDAAARLVQSAPAPNPGLLDTLAAAQARANRFPEAVATLEHAIAIIESMSSSRNRLSTKFRQRLDLYRHGIPYTEDAFSRWLAQAYGQGLQTSSKVSAP